MSSGKAFLIDTTLCTACRGCQIACKQWNQLPATKTTNWGSMQNPKDLSYDTYKLVRFQEHNGPENKPVWYFFPDQCRHCLEPPCEDTAGDPSAIFTNPSTGAVIYTANTRALDAGEIRQSCPYDIPRQAKDGTIAKCDMCSDRVENGLEPACVKVCPTGAMNFGDREDIMKLAQKHLAAAQKKYPNAMLIDPDDIRTIYLVGFDPNLYHEYSVASATEYGISRQAALRKMLHPFTGLVSRLG
jgi:formate dehydrogenase iron-sulfur subunit